MSKRFHFSARLQRIGRHARPWQMILVLATFHLAVTTTVFLVGRFQLMPSHFTQSGIGSFAADGRYYQTEIDGLSALLANGHFSAWIRSQVEYHDKLYSISNVLFTRVTTCNILTIEPLNNLYYVLITILIFFLAERAFNRRVAFISAAVVALWPSWLLHTTQPIREPLLIVALLTLFLVICFSLTRSMSWRQGLSFGLLAAIAAGLVWMVRLSMWDVIRAATGLAVILLVVAQIHGRRFMVGNTISTALLVIAITFIPTIARQIGRLNPGIVGVQERRPVHKGKVVRGVTAVELQEHTIWERISARRQGYTGTNDREIVPGSSIDIDKQFHSFGDVVRFLPRAAVVGALSPFPNMWFSPGMEVGFAGRLLSGAETLLTYVLELLALIGLWKSRDRLMSWFTVCIFALGVVGLGLIVANIGSLYRFRYPFVMLLVPLGVFGALQLWNMYASRNQAGGKLSTTG